MKKILTITLMAVMGSVTFAQKSETITVKIYFLNEKSDPGLMDCQAVKPVERTIPKSTGVAKAALLELFKGVNADEAAKGFVSFSPESTSGILKGLKIKNDAAYVNFDKIVFEKLGNATTSCGGGFFSSIENTLVQFPSIKKGKVIYAVEGNTDDFYEWMQVGECPHGKKHCAKSNFQ